MLHERVQQEVIHLLQKVGHILIGSEVCFRMINIFDKTLKCI